MRYASLVAFLSVLPACPLLDVQTSVQETCATYHDIQVDAVPAGTQMISHSFTYDQLQSISGLASLGTDLAFTRAEVRATSGITDFSFVKGAQLSIASGDPNSTLPTVMPFACTDCDSAGTTLDIATGDAVDAKAYVESGSLIVTVDLAGTPPDHAWTMDADICMSGSISYTLQP